MKMTWRMYVYVVLAFLGLVLPWYYNYQFILESQGTFSLAAFISGAFANAASSSLGMDLLIAASTFVFWMINEHRRLKMRHLWAYFAVMCLIAFACACPLFLLMRERRLQVLESEG